MLVLVGVVVAGAVVVGAVVSVAVGAGATGSVVVALLEDAVVVVTAGVVDEVAGDVEPPPFVSSTIPKITSAIRIAATTPKPTKTAGLRCHGVDPGSGCCCPSSP
jgi:hypothetical protein